nr:ABC transporter ATP-binding protein [Candidatus Sigynarchaeota archaeon]
MTLAQDSEWKDGMPLLKLVKVNKEYAVGTKTLRVLKDVDLEIEKGELVSIMGPSGSGKSTLLNLIAALDSPTSGKIYLQGFPLHAFPDYKLTLLRRTYVGIIFQFYNLIPFLTAMENVLLAMDAGEQSVEQARAKTGTLLSSVGLETKMQRYPTELSGGEQQRLSIARALANDPLIILADEPTGNLDQKSGKEVMKIFERLNQERKQTFLIVTHDPVIASRTNRIITLVDGVIQPGGAR